MERSGKVMGKLLGLAWLLLVLAAPGMARGAEFSAQMLVKDGVKTMPGKIYVQDGKMRQEFLDVEGQTVTIVRPDQKVVWVILPRQRCYLEMPLKIKLPGQFIQIPPQAIEQAPGGQGTAQRLRYRQGSGFRARHCRDGDPDLLGGP